MLLRIIDIETTGDDPTAEIIEFGRVDVKLDEDAPHVEAPLSWLFRPFGEIPPEAMAVHHITPNSFSVYTPTLTNDLLWSAVHRGSRPDVLVAHNCDFERQFISDEVTESLPWICTYKAALHIWPDAPAHSNQVLRYWRELDLDPSLAMPPHRAGPDAYVTAHILADLLKFASVPQMIDWTRGPRPLLTIPFGKHQGLRWADVPLEYLQWMSNEAEMDRDTHSCACDELQRRRTQQGDGFYETP